YTKVADDVKNSWCGKLLINEIARLKRLEPGAEAPDFSFPNPAEQIVSLQDVVAKCKYTVIDLWASWCKPCRMGFPAMKELYSKYKSKGVNIISVSTDKSEEAWRKASEEENLPWHTVLQTPGFARDVYNVQMI